MLKRLHLRNFTVFADAEFEFGEGLNVLVGTNGTGKTHMLKAGYAKVYSLFIATKTSGWEPPRRLVGIDKQHSDVLYLFNKIENVFQTPHYFSTLVRKNTDLRSTTIESVVKISNGEFKDSLLMPADYDNESAKYDSQPITLEEEIASPVFIPAKEVLTLVFEKH